MSSTADYASSATAASSQSGPVFPPPPQGQWTYDDYARLPDNGYRYEVIDGNLYMSPSSRWKHQIAITNLIAALVAHGRDHGSWVVTAPMDLLMGDVATPVQPDVIVIGADQMSIFAESGRLEGVPLLLVEVLSPSTREHDERVKFDAYFRAGVPEYWIADPDSGTITVHVRRGEAWAPTVFERDDVARSEVLAGFGVGVASVFTL